MLELKQIIIQISIVLFIILSIFVILCELSDFTRKYKSTKRKIKKYERILEIYENKNCYKDNDNKL